MAVTFAKLPGQFNGKTFIWLLVFLILSIILILSTTWDLKSSFRTQLVDFHNTFKGSVSGGMKALSASRSFTKCEGPLRVYMYEIPQKFNIGMLKQGSNQELPWKEEIIPPWPSGSGLKVQHSVEYWMMAYLLGSESRKDIIEERVAIRVLDPLKADVFFVPFFSSWSFNIHGVNMLDPETEKDRLLQVEIVSLIRNSSWWQNSGGRDHVFPMHHPNALRFMKEEINSSIFIVADFGRFAPSVARLQKDIVAPYAHVVASYANDNISDPFEARTTLLFFKGRIRRKDDGIVRIKLAKLLQKHPNVIYEESEAKNGGVEMALQGMRSSRFCLHPAGDTPSSCRLFDAIVSHCVPVIVSDRLELPFEDELNYEEFSLFISVEDALRPGYLIKTLEGFPKEKWLSMWNNLKRVSHHFEYQYPPRKDDAVNMLWKEVQRKLPSVRLAIHRSKRLKVPDWWRR